jgi:hypothetical protein
VALPAFLAAFLAVATIITVMPRPAAADPVDVVCSNRISIWSDDERLRIPYCRNKSISRRNTSITRAIIVIHGTNRNADDYYDYLKTATKDEDQWSSTLVIAPQFLTAEDLDEHTISSENSFLYWSSGGWKRGDLSKDSPRSRPFRVSSFEVVDQIVDKIARDRYFPNLEDIFIVGHSAGGQFVNRYAAGTQSPENHPGLDFTFMPANPSSWWYMGTNRPEPGSVSNFRNLTSSEKADCPDYNEYKYGYEDLNSYMGAHGKQGLRDQYETRNVVYLLGRDDDDPDSSSLDKSCEANWQGPHRFARGEAFYNYLLRHYQDSSVYDTHIKAVVPGVGHSGRRMFNSDEAKSYLFP